MVSLRTGSFHHRLITEISNRILLQIVRTNDRLSDTVITQKCGHGSRGELTPLILMNSNIFMVVLDIFNSFFNYSLNIGALADWNEDGIYGYLIDEIEEMLIPYR